jgi:hypothetical protein
VRDPNVVYDYSYLKLNEVSGVGDDSVKFYELINTGTEVIDLAGVTIHYNANSNTGEPMPTGDGNLTWTGGNNGVSHIIQPGGLLLLQGRNNSGKYPGSFTTGLTAARKLIITMKAPNGTVLDQCIRAEDTGGYNFTTKSFSRIPDGTGSFYFTEPTPGAMNVSDPTGLTAVPDGSGIVANPTITSITRVPQSPTDTDAVVISATVTAGAGTLTSVKLGWKLSGADQADITMTAAADVYSATIPKQVVGATVAYTITAVNSEGGELTSASNSYSVAAHGAPPIDYTPLKLNEVSGVGTDAEKFYELMNIGDVPINLSDVKIYYNNSSPFSGDGNLTWTGCATQVIQPGQLLGLIGRNTECSFTTGLSASALIQVTMRTPTGELIDKFARAANPSPNITDKSYSRIPDGDGAFFFTTPTPGVMNGTSSDGLTPVSQTMVTNPVIDLAHSPSSPTASEAVTVTATITTAEGTIISAMLGWKLDGVDQTSLYPSSTSGDVYTYTIPAQAAEAVVAYTLTATNNVGGTATATGGYTVGGVTPQVIDYTKLVLNEINGNTGEKWFEIYNKGDVAINLDGVKAYYRASTTYNITWTGTSANIIPAYGYFQCTDLQTGLSANNGGIGLRLDAPDGTVLDTHERPNAITGTLQNKSHARVPDGTGLWYITDSGTGTPGATNGSSTDGYTLVNE